MLAYRGGEELGPYQVLQFLGRGSFGVVLLAEDPWRPQQRFALKLVPCDHLDAGAATRARDAALAEAGLLRQLRHPHVVTCHDVAWEAERHVVWLALDYMDGGDLQSVVDSRRRASEPPLEAPFMRRIIAAVGSALRYIHSQGVLHRDVKPSNVLLSREPAGGGPGEIKLADFGISKLLEVTGQAHTVVGTPPYMSPELVRGEPYGAASDAWALGVTLYELAALHRPFEAGNQLALVRQIVEQQQAPLPHGTAPDVARVVMGLLHKDPGQRMQLRVAEAMALSTAARSLVPRTPPPSFPPPASPRCVAPGTLLVQPVLGQAAAPKLVRQHSATTAVSEEDLQELTALPLDQATVQILPGEAGGGAEAQSLPMPTPRPARAFEPEEAVVSKAKDSRRNMRWLPRFGMSLRGSSSKRAAVSEESTAISAFDPDVGDEDESPPAAISPVSKWTLLSAPRV